MYKELQSCQHLSTSLLFPCISASVNIKCMNSMVNDMNFTKSVCTGFVSVGIYFLPYTLLNAFIILPSYSIQ